MTRDEKARALWLDERRKGIGGSDMADLFELPELGGCQRRLWYDKTNTPPDVPRLPLLVMRRGQALEALAAAEYKRKHPTCAELKAVVISSFRDSHSTIFLASESKESGRLAFHSGAA